MKNEKDSKEKIHRAGSSTSGTSEVIESVDLTVTNPATSIEPNRLSQVSRSELLTNRNIVVAHHAAANIFETVLDTAFQVPTTSGQPGLIEATPDERPVARLPNSQPNLRGPRADLRMMRISTGGMINSSNGLHNENYVKQMSSKKSVVRIPPSYSTVLKLGPPITEFDSPTYPSIPFITRQPPPSYAEVQHGAWDENPSMISADSLSLGPNPLYISCPRCRTIVVSDIHTERSHLSYIVSLVLCVCLCWPCCLLPFCLKSCRNTYHFCPTCHYYLGVYRPC